MGATKIPGDGRKDKSKTFLNHLYKRVHLKLAKQARACETKDMP